MGKEFNPTDQLEPGSRADTNLGYRAQLSIAISLKRIADMMSETNEYGEGPAAAIGAGIARAMRSGG